MKSGPSVQQLARFVVPFLMLWAPAALAVPVTVQPGGYQGQWTTAGVWYSGPRTLDLAPGVPHLFYVGVRGALHVTVSADGTVTSSNAVAAVGGLHQLTFNTVPVRVEPAGYTGTWSLQYATGKTQGPLTVELVPGLAYLARVGGYGAIGFGVAANGDVSSEAPASATSAGNVLTFLTAPVTFDPKEFTGSWAVEAAYGRFEGVRTLSLVPGQGYFMNIGGHGGFRFDVDAAGVVSSQAPASAQGVGSTLTLRTVPVALYPRDYAGGWAVEYAVPLRNGYASVRLVPGVRYRFQVGGWGGFTFVIENNGTVTSEAPASAAAQGNALVLNTVAVRIAPRASAQGWGLGGHASAPLPFAWTGRHTLKLVPGVQYQLQAMSPYATELFTVTETCAPSPGYVALGSAGFDLGCTE
ncbi:MAG TPA: hypothetical protein VE153_30015 [Myxococcus sp.]|nr:hypothetical protein [Myxococcus sp.]